MGEKRTRSDLLPPPELLVQYRPPLVRRLHVLVDLLNALSKPMKGRQKEDEKPPTVQHTLEMGM